MKGITISKLKSFHDKRGEFVELWRRTQDKGFWEEDDITVNKKGVLRGLHGDRDTWKLISCIFGKVFFAAVIPSTKEEMHLVLSDSNHLQVETHPYIAVGYLALTDPAIVHYKQSFRYGDAPEQFTLPWNGFGIPWPIKKPILSKRDADA